MRNIRNSLKLIGLVAFISAVSLWFVSTDYPTIIKNRYFTGSIESYMNVSIGDKREDVLYKLGRPNFVLGELGQCTDDKPYDCFSRRVYYTDQVSDDINKIDKDIKFYNVYGYYADALGSDHFSLYFDEQNKVKSILCKGACDTVLGVGISSDERALMRLLGNPSSFEIDAASGVKTISYTRFNLTFYLTRMNVYMIAVGPTD